MVLDLTLFVQIIHFVGAYWLLRKGMLQLWYEHLVHERQSQVHTQKNMTTIEKRILEKQAHMASEQARAAALLAASASRCATPPDQPFVKDFLVDVSKEAKWPSSFAVDTQMVDRLAADVVSRITNEAS